MHRPAFSRKIGNFFGSWWPAIRGRWRQSRRHRPDQRGGLGQGDARSARAGMIEGGRTPGCARSLPPSGLDGVPDGES